MSRDTGQFYISYEDFDVFCVVCGGAFHRDGYGPPEVDWWESVLIRAPKTHDLPPDGDEGYQDCPERHDGRGQLMEIIHASTTACGPQQFYDPTQEGSLADRLFYSVCDGWEDYPWIGLHPKCLEIAERVLDWKKTSPEPTGATSMGELYEIYRWRCILQVQARGPWPVDPPLCVLHEPHGYYGADKGHGAYKECVWNYHEPETLEYEACPFPLQGITEELLKHLKPLPSLEAMASLPQTFVSLPAEIEDEILKQLHPFINPSLARILPPSTWRRFLFSGTLLPWLWDLNPSILTSQQSNNNPPFNADGAWDWELLVRQLAQVEVFEDGNIMADVQLGLRNRRRIWRLVDDARMGDSAAVLKHWGDAGYEYLSCQY